MDVSPATAQIRRAAPLGNAAAADARRASAEGGRAVVGLSAGAAQENPRAATGTMGRTIHHPARPLCGLIQAKKKGRGEAVFR